MNKEKESKGFAFHTDDFISKKELASELEKMEKKIISNKFALDIGSIALMQETRRENDNIMNYNRALQDLKQKFGL